jgi:hypothetical protein
MTGHLWDVHELSGKSYLIVTKSNNEETARETFRKSLGSSVNIYKVKYVGFVSAIE